MVFNFLLSIFYFLQFKSEFGNKEFMIWATVSPRSCFYWLYRTSPSLASDDIINLISVLTIWWCPYEESSLVLVDEGVCYDQYVLLANSISLCPASFCIPRPNLPVTLASGGDGIPVELFQTLKDDAVKVLHSICQQIWKTQQWPQDWKDQFSF